MKALGFLSCGVIWAMDLCTGLCLLAVPKDVQDQEEVGEEAEAESPYSSLDPHAYR